MKLLIAFILTISYAFASNLLTYNIYERSDRVDVMLSFDSPYDGNIYQKKEGNSIGLTLNGLIFDEKVSKNINSNIVQELNILPSNNSTLVQLVGNGPISVIASKTVDGFGLRIRSRPLSASAEVETMPVKETPTSNVKTTRSPLPTQDSLVDARYITVIGVLFVLVIFLMWLRVKITKINRNSTKVPANWLFKNAGSNEMMKVLYQKPLDNQNRVVLFDFQGRQYLVMTGNSNVLLDKVNDTSVESENDFQEVFEKNRQKLDEYLKIQQNPLNDYKEKVSQDYSPNRVKN